MSERPRIRVAVLGGGRSSEHEVSLRSAASVVAALDPERFDVVPVQIDRGGAWQIESSAQPSLEPGHRQVESSARLALEPGAESRSLVPTAPAGLPAPAGIGPIDVVLPILHGPFGEDGRLQGLLDMINIPYVGSGVAASALTMDKDKVKYVLRGVGIAVADHVVLRNRRFGAADAEAVERLGYPCFVKPANLGSSVGISKVTAPEGLAAAVELAFRHDRTVLVEEMIGGTRGGAGRAREQRSAGQPAGRDRDRQRLRLVRLLGQVRRGRHAAAGAGRLAGIGHSRAAGRRPPRLRGLRVQRHGPHRLLRDARAIGWC